ncbi:unnamed protein product [Heterobilharzia americana]|nr:unnamed protein product [Heterobilharzia americana]
MTYLLAKSGLYTSNCAFFEDKVILGLLIHFSNFIPINYVFCHQELVDEISSRTFVISFALHFRGCLVPLSFTRSLRQS